MHGFLCRVHDDSDHVGNINMWQPSQDEQSRLIADQQAAVISYSPICHSWSNAEVRGMRFRSEPADLDKVFQDSGVAVAVPHDQDNISTYVWSHRNNL